MLFPSFLEIHFYQRSLGQWVFIEVIDNLYTPKLVKEHYKLKAYILRATKTHKDQDETAILMKLWTSTWMCSSGTGQPRPIHSRSGDTVAAVLREPFARTLCNLLQKTLAKKKHQVSLSKGKTQCDDLYYSEPTLHPGGRHADHRGTYSDWLCVEHCQILLIFTWDFS